MKIWSIFCQSQIRKIAYADGSFWEFHHPNVEAERIPLLLWVLPFLLATSVGHSVPKQIGSVADVMCPSAHFKDQSGSSPPPGGAQTHQTKINYAFCRASKRRAASIACARILSESYPHSFAIWWRIRRTSATIGLSFISLLQINVIKKGFRRHDVRTMKARLAHNLFRQRQGMRISHVSTIPCQQHVHSRNTRSRNVKESVTALGGKACSLSNCFAS